MRIQSACMGSRKKMENNFQTVVTFMNSQNTLITDTAWDDTHPLSRLSDQEKREMCASFEWETKRLKKALRLATKWGIRSDGFSAEVSDSIRVWIDGGMLGDPPEAPSYYPCKNAQHIHPVETP